MKKVALGLSGGVDSAVAAQILKQQGYQVQAFYLSCWQQPGCQTDINRKDAIKTALHLDISIQVLDFIAEYRTIVMDYFYAEYKAGRTPNPDVLCNSEIKFGLFYNWAMSHDFDYIATGHYIRNLKLKEEQHILLTAKDVNKDQSYFLYRLKAEQLPHLLFPIGDLYKTEVRTLAHKYHLPVADKPDSMGICFVGEVSIQDLLKEKYGVKKGEVQLNDGTVIGEHEGYWFYTIGQRGNFKLQARNLKKTNKFDTSNLPKFYVVDIDKNKNVVIVGKRQECLKNEFAMEDVYWLNPKSNAQGLDLFVKIRNTGKFMAADLLKNNDNYLVKLKELEFGVSPGQSCVIYRKFKNGFEMLGGGVIKY